MDEKMLLHTREFFRYASPVGRKRKRHMRIRIQPTVQLLSLAFLTMSLVVVLALWKREEIYRLLSEASGTPANLVVQTQTPLGELPRPWVHLAQGGEDLTTDMIAPVISQTHAIAPQTIRIDHIYDGYDVVGRNDQGQLTFNWTRLDQIVGSIIQTDATPMLSLSYMPPAIASGDIISPPRDWNEWSLVVQRTIEHYSGERAIPNIAYEVWNEPDLFGGWKARASGDRSYFELYKWSAIGASRAAVRQPYKLGGPATTAPYPAWVAGLLKYAQDNNFRLDFLSWHRYTKDMKTFTDDLELVDRELLKFPELAARMERYVTEWGPDSENHPSNDSTVGAAHLVSVARATLGQIDRLYTFEIVDGKSPENQPLWGRWGLLTHPEFGAQQKPRYQAMQLLNRMTGIRLNVTGEGSWVRAIATRKSDGVLQILIVNYDQFGSHSEQTPLAIEGLRPGGNYRLARQLLGGGTTPVTIAADEAGVLRTTLSLPANSVMLIEIPSS